MSVVVDSFFFFFFDQRLSKLLKNVYGIGGVFFIDFHFFTLNVPTYVFGSSNKAS